LNDQIVRNARLPLMLDELGREVRKARAVSWERIRAMEWDAERFGGEYYCPYRQPHSEQLSAVLTEISSIASDLHVDKEIVREFERAGGAIAGEFVALNSRKIHRGFLTPVFESLIPISINLFALLKIEGDRDHLIRENHNFGFHYHYVLADRRRTTTLICWDTRWMSSDKCDPKGIKTRPLFHQLHNDSSGGVRATPDRWGKKKRESVRAACATDLGRQHVLDFLCAADDATSVWPMSLKVTARPAPPLAVFELKERRKN
jgi:hypothetical protein